LTPTPERNHTQRNEPAFVRSVLLKLAEVRCQDPVLVSETLWDNTCRLYGVESWHGPGPPVTAEESLEEFEVS